MRNALLVLSGLFATSAATAQIVIQNTSTPEELVQNTLLGTGVVISNVTINGMPGNSMTEQFGFFDGENCNVGIDYGVILAAGNVSGAAGPNNTGSSTVGGGLFGQSDPDLATLGTSPTINDAAVLEFDFVPVSDTVMFQFVFGSEEYLEFVNTGFNDVYGFFLSGPGISGPYTNNAINIAMLPGSNTPITVDNVNSTTNAAYYVDNGDGYTAPYNTDPQYIQYDGFTVPITIIAEVTPGETHHMKIAIGDAGDTAYDCAVFLSGASFMSPEDVNTGIPGQAGHGEIALSPNPATDRVRFAYGADGATTIRVCDAMGREVARMLRPATSSGVRYETFDVSDWSAGYYRVMVTSQDGAVHTATLVVAH